MKKLLLVLLVGTFCVACDRNVQQPKAGHTHSASEVAPDKATTDVSPVDQSASTEDLNITQAIRQKIVAHKNLSMSAKNVKVITRNGIVILRGAVNNPDEKNAIEQLVHEVQGVQKIDNQIQIQAHHS